ncbi:MAG: AAA family ATPase [Bacillota bacterium]|nr:AAA family ATPase [Bacillota bacterium]
MGKIKTIVITDEESRRYDIRLLLNDEEIAVVGYATCDNSAVDKAAGLNCAVAVIDYEYCKETAFQVASKIYNSLPLCSVLLIAENMDLDTLEKAMSSGVKRVITPNSLFNPIEAVKDVYNFESSRSTGYSEQVHESKVISIFSGSGGIGRTTIAANMGVSLAKQGKKVLLIDICLQFGNANLFLDLDSKEGIAELVQENNKLSIEIIKGYCSTHVSGLQLLSSTKSPEYAEYVTAKHIESIISLVRPFYEYIIIDCPASLSEVTITALENSDSILMIVDQTISSLHSAKTSLMIFEVLHLEEKIQIVISRSQKSTINSKYIEQFFEMSILHELPCDWAAALSSLNRGIPIVQLYPKSKIAKSISELIYRL